MQRDGMGTAVGARRGPSMHLARGIDVGDILYQALDHSCLVVDSRTLQRSLPLRAGRGRLRADEGRGIRYKAEWWAGAVWGLRGMGEEYLEGVLSAGSVSGCDGVRVGGMAVQRRWRRRACGDGAMRRRE